MCDQSCSEQHTIGACLTHYLLCPDDGPDTFRALQHSVVTWRKMLVTHQLDVLQRCGWRLLMCAKSDLDPAVRSLNACGHGCHMKAISAAISSKVMAFHNRAHALMQEARQKHAAEHCHSNAAPEEDASDVEDASCDDDHDDFQQVLYQTADDDLMDVDNHDDNDCERFDDQDESAHGQAQANYDAVVTTVNKQDSRSYRLRSGRGK